MENASSNIAQGGPNTPGAPPTPQEQTSYVGGPGTPGSQNSTLGSSNPSHGKMGPSLIASPHPGKGASQSSLNQHHASMNVVTQYPAAPQVASQQTGQRVQSGILSPQQQAIRPTPPYQSPPPTRAMMAAKQAEQVARAQASTVRPPMQSSYPRPVNQGTIQQRPGLSAPVPQQTQWVNQAGDMSFRQGANAAMQMPTSNAMQQSGKPSNISGNQDNNKLRDMLNKNPHLTAHVIKQTRQQQQQRPHSVQVCVFKFIELT